MGGLIVAECEWCKKRVLDIANETPLELVEAYQNSDHFDLCLTKCKHCGQFFGSCYIEVTMDDGDDDSWNFWVPVEPSEVEQIRSRPARILELVEERKHIVWQPDGKIFWAERPEIALIYAPFYLRTT